MLSCDLLSKCIFDVLNYNELGKINEDVVNYLLPSHRSTEPGHINILKEIGLEPMLDLNMRLGEGTGAVLAMNIVEAATRIIKDMATFAEASVSNKE